MLRIRKPAGSPVSSAQVKGVISPTPSMLCNCRDTVAQQGIIHQQRDHGPVNAHQRFQLTSVEAKQAVQGFVHAFGILQQGGEILLAVQFARFIRHAVSISRPALLFLNITLARTISER